MNPTIEIKQGINCHYIETRGVNVDDVPPGRYRLIDEVAIEELWDEWVDCLEGQDKEQVTMILTAAGLERKRNED
jgi:hypothetical protein